MIRKFVNNIDLVRFVFSGQQETLYFPISTNFREQKIDRLIFNATANASDPNTNRAFVSDLSNIYLYARNKEQKQIIDGVAVSLMQSGNFTQIVEVDSYLDFDNTFLKVNAPKTANTTLFCYVVYSEESKQELGALRELGVRIPAGYDGRLSEFINSVFYGKVYEITATMAQTSPFFLTLQTVDNRNFELLVADLFANGANPKELNKIYFNGIVPDFQQTRIVTTSQDIYLTFKFLNL